MAADQVPSIGRIVHYRSHGTPIRPDGSQAYTSQCRAAIITELTGETVHDGGACVSLCVLNPTGQFFNQHVCQDETADDRRGGTWHWPERV